MKYGIFHMEYGIWNMNANMNKHKKDGKKDSESEKE